MEQNKIYHIDCLDGFKQLDDKSVNHVFTSPPYNRKRNDKYEHHNDCIDDYFGWLCNVIDECIRVSKGYVFFNIMKNYYNKQDVFKLIYDIEKNKQLQGKVDFLNFRKPFAEKEIYDVNLKVSYYNRLQKTK
jgi:DNA modification methylase